MQDFVLLPSIMGRVPKSHSIHVQNPTKSPFCRNRTLAKCGGEAQHSQSWGLGVLRDSRMFTVRQQGPKLLALRRSWCHSKGLEA
jgi:hypothetical protein